MKISISQLFAQLTTAAEHGVIKNIRFTDALSYDIPTVKMIVFQVTNPLTKESMEKLTHHLQNTCENILRVQVQSRIVAIWYKRG